VPFKGPPHPLGKSPDEYLAENWREIATNAWKNYLKNGRGALIFDFSPKATKRYDYASGAIIGKVSDRFKDMARLAKYIQEYNPNREVVLMVRDERGVFVLTGAPPEDPLTPPEAYASLKARKN
jgi:hypothetical protein